MRNFFLCFSFVIFLSVWTFAVWELFSYSSERNSSTIAVGDITNITPSPISYSPTPNKVLGIKKTRIPTIAQSTLMQTSKESYILNGINEYRKSKGLVTVVSNSLTCSFAQIRANEIISDFSHKGFQDRLTSRTLPYPNYSLVTENIAETSDYTRVVSLWANSPGHAANMRAETPYVCVESNGNFYAYEGWKPQ